MPTHEALFACTMSGKGLTNTAKEGKDGKRVKGVRRGAAPCPA